MQLDVYFLPQHTTEAELAGQIVVVIDVLRATTTIVQALWSGASEVVACLEVEEASQIAKRLGDDAVLGGERGGTRIPGFQLGNSPAEYMPQIVAGKTIVFTTTNGTRAMRRCQAASRVLLGAFVNMSSLVASLRSAERVALLCAGTDGHITREDVLFAGAIVTELRDHGCDVDTNDEAEIAAAAWKESVASTSQIDRLIEAMRASRGGRNLEALGYSNDISLAARIDTCPLIAELRVDTWRIVKSDFSGQPE